MTTGPNRPSEPSKKLADKQQRRLAEERRRAEHRSAARRRNLVTFGLVGLIGLGVVALVASERNKDKEAATGPIGVASEEAGCSDVELPEKLGQDHVEEGTQVNYNTQPPTSGPHYSTTASPGFSAEQLPPGNLVHNLEHGQVVIWYRPGAPEDVISDIETYVDTRDPNLLALVASPYDALPGTASFALTAWGALQTCSEVSSEVIDRFRAEFQGKGPENVGVPTFDG